MSITLIKIEEIIKALSLTDKKASLKTLLQEIENPQSPGTRQDMRTTLTLEALDDVDAGRFVEHSDVEAWAGSLSPRGLSPFKKR